MISRINLKEFGDFIPVEASYVFSASSLDVVNKTRFSKYHEKVLETIEKGKVEAVFTSLELKKLKNYVGEKNYRKIYQKIWDLRDSLVVVLEIDDVSRLLSSNEAYSRLHKLYLNQNIHLADLSSVFVAIEYKIPLITDDDHHWGLQQAFQKIYRERHSKGKTSPGNLVFKMYSSEDFCKFLKF